MPSYNLVILMGHLTREPELRTTPNGTAICNIGLAINRNWKDQNGNNQSEVTYVDVTVFQRSAEYCARYLRKGSAVMVEGRLHLEQWEDRNGGGKRSRLTVIANAIRMIGDPNNQQLQQQYTQQPQYTQGGYQQQYTTQQPPQPRFTKEDEPYTAEDDLPF